MSHNIRITSPNQQSGKTVYNASIIQNIVEIAVAEVEGTVTTFEKKSGVTLHIEKDKVYANVSVVVKYGFNVPELAYRIQQSVRQSVENMTHYKVGEVNVHIQDVVFDESVHIEKEEPHEEEQHHEESER